MKLKKYKVCSVFLVLFVIMSVICGTVEISAKNTENRVIRVAYPKQEGITDYDEYGRRSGYTYEYLEEIAQYTGWDYEFVDYEGDINESLTNLMGQLKDGEIDLMGAVVYSDKMESVYDYSSYNYGVGQTVLRVPIESDKNIVINSQINQNFKVATMRTSNKIKQEFEEYCKSNLITPEYVYCDTNEELAAAVRYNNADLMLDSNMNYVDGMRIVASFAPKPFYFITTKNKNSELMYELNEAILSIEQANPYFQTELYEKYFGSKNEELILSHAELEYVKNSPKIKVGVVMDQAPYQYEYKGELTGISIDMLEYISDKTGLQFEYINADNYTQLFQMAEQGDIKLIAGISYNYQLARERNWVMSQPYVSSQYMILMNSKNMQDNESPVGKNLAMIVNTQYQGEYIGKIKQYETMSECLQAVSKGKADYTYVDANTAQYYINMPKYKNLKSIPQSIDERKICFGAVKPCDHELLSILNKSISTISVLDLQDIINQNNIKKGQVSLFDTIRENPISSIFIISGILLLIIFILLVFLRQRALTNKKNDLELKKHFMLFALLNEYIIEYDFRTNSAIVYDPAKDGDGHIKEYNFNIVQKDERKAQASKLFLDLIKSMGNGVEEIKLWCGDEYHWLRVAIETVYDDKVPIYAIGKINIIDNEKNEKEELIEKSRLDSLTKIYNAETTRVYIKKELSKLKEGQYGAFIIIDIDYFKNINDTYGHLNGDKVLKKLASVLNDAYGSAGVVGRLGGDEFVVYLQNVEDKDELTKICTDMCEEIRNIKNKDGNGITISVGAKLSQYGDEYNDIYRKSDKALYKAKSNGRDGYIVD